MEDPFELVESILQRPRMFSRAENLRELMIFVEGVGVGRYPPRGFGLLDGFQEYVQVRFGSSPTIPWGSVVIEEYGGLPYFEGCRAVLELMRDWRATRVASATED